MRIQIVYGFITERLELAELGRFFRDNMDYNVAMQGASNNARPDGSVAIFIAGTTQINADLGGQTCTVCIYEEKLSRTSESKICPQQQWLVFPGHLF